MKKRLSRWFGLGDLHLTPDRNISSPLPPPAPAPVVEPKPSPYLVLKYNDGGGTRCCSWPAMPEEVMKKHLTDALAQLVDSQRQFVYICDDMVVAKVSFVFLTIEYPSDE